MSTQHQMRVAMLSLHSCPLAQPGTRDTGGMSVYVQQVARHLGERGMAVDLFTCDHSPAMHSGRGLGGPVRLIHLPPERNQEKLALYASLPDLACAIYRFGEGEGLTYDLVHSHYWLSGGVGATLARWWQVPHVVTLHTSARAKNHHLGAEVETELRAETERQILETASLIVASTEGEKEDLVQLYGAEPKKMVVIPCGVDLRLFHPLPKPWARWALGLNGAKLVLYVGRIEPEKGIDLLLQAIALMGARPEVELLVVGGDEADGEELARLRQLSRELGIAPRTHFQRAVDQALLPLYYGSADVLVLPSRYETFGLVAAEALACGTPVIASRVGAMDNLILPGRTGFLMEEASSDHLAHLLHRLLVEGALPPQPQALCRSTVAGLNWPRVAEKVVAEYSRLLKPPLVDADEALGLSLARSQRNG